MIYALVGQDAPHDERLAISQAIRENDSDVIRQHVADGTIVHIMDVQSDTRRDFVCIFCRNPVFASRKRAPSGRHAQQPWHFEHKGTGHTPGKCVGHERHRPIPNSLGIKNPEAHGCYIQLGCETDTNGGPTVQHRTRCKTIDNGRTHCHLARQPEHQCIPTHL